MLFKLNFIGHISFNSSRFELFSSNWIQIWWFLNFEELIEMSALENCAKSISKARSLRNLNIFITETFESATEQAKLSQKRIQEGLTVWVFFSWL